MDARTEARRLYQEEHLSPSDIAKKLDVSPGTVRSWKKRDNWDEDPEALHGNATQRNAKKNRERRTYKNTKIANEVDATPGLTELEKDFCIHYVGSFNATQSAIKAGYEGTYASLRNIGYELLRTRIPHP